MVKTFDDVQKLNKDTVDATLKSLGALSTTAQAIAVGRFGALIKALH